MKICPTCQYRGPEQTCPNDHTPMIPLEQYESRVTGRHDKLIGRVFDGKYRLDALLGRGGMGAVYRARHLTMEADVAVKILLQDERAGLNAVQRFINEARACSQLHHPNTIRVSDFGSTDDGYLYLVMELLEGHDLKQALTLGKPFPVERAIAITRQIAQSLDEAHVKGIVHRDLKPGNIFLTHVHRRTDFVKVIDFGISKVYHDGNEDEHLTVTGTVVGTPLYMSPEQIQGKTLDGRSDLYTLGVILYEMLSGTVPFDATTPTGLLVAHINDVPRPLPRIVKGHELPSALCALVNSLLAKAPSDRPASGAALDDGLAAIERSLMGSATGAPGAPISQSTPVLGAAATAALATPTSTSRRRGALIGLAAAIAIAVLVGAVLMFSQKHSDEDKTDEATPALVVTTADSAGSGASTNTTLSPAKDVVSEQAPLVAPDVPPPAPDVPPPAPDVPPPSPEIVRHEPGEVITPEGSHGGPMVYVPGGTFLVGSTDAEIQTQVEQCVSLTARGICSSKTFQDQKSHREATIPPLFVDRMEVTNAAYDQCEEAGACTIISYTDCGVLRRNGSFKPSKRIDRDALRADELPVVCVSAEEAATFCRWAGKRLPTEEEWEFIASEGGHKLYPWGQDVDREGKRSNGADLSLKTAMGRRPRFFTLKVSDGHAFTVAPGSFPEGQSALGLLDLAGNVAEWTSSTYGSYNSPPAASSARGVARGGSWVDLGPFVGSRARRPMAKDTRRSDLGFRCVRDVDPEKR